MNRKFHLLSGGLQKSRESHETVLAELREAIKKCRNFIKANKAGAYSYLESYPCGYQDAFADKVEKLFDQLEVLKIARAVQISNQRILSRVCNAALEDM